jgi:hypothetical protein
LAGDDDRNASTVHHGSADRTEQHSGESATAVATDDDQLGRLGLVEKTAGRLIPNHHPFDADVGVAFLPAGQPDGNSWLPPLLRTRVIPEPRSDSRMNNSVRVTSTAVSTPAESAETRHA